MKLQDSAYMRSIQQQIELAATMAASLKAVSFVASPETIKAIENFGQRAGPYITSFENSKLHKPMTQSVELATQMECAKLSKWNGFSLKPERGSLAPLLGFTPGKVLASALGGGLNQRSP